MPILAVILLAQIGGDIGNTLRVGVEILHGLPLLQLEQNHRIVAVNIGKENKSQLPRWKEAHHNNKYCDESCHRGIAPCDHKINGRLIDGCNQPLEPSGYPFLKTCPGLAYPVPWFFMDIEVGEM